jgi:hypothetical protein
MEQKNRKFAHEYQLQAVGRDINVKNPTMTPPSIQKQYREQIGR